MFASFPFDNVCSTDTPVPSDYEGMHTIFDLDNESYNITIAADDNVSYYCLQDLFRKRPSVFPAVPSFIEESSNYMTSGQKDISSIYGWSSVGALVLIFFLIMSRDVFSFFKSLFVPPYRVSHNGEDWGQAYPGSS
jgi:hypothetical protein